MVRPDEAGRGPRKVILRHKGTYQAWIDTSGRALILPIRSGCRRRGSRPRRFMWSCTSIDDFGLRRLDATPSSDIHEIIVERHRCSSTILTSNCISGEARTIHRFRRLGWPRRRLRKTPPPVWGSRAHLRSLPAGRPGSGRNLCPLLKRRHEAGRSNRVQAALPLHS